MASSKVYFTNLRAKPSQNLLKKLGTLVDRAGIDKIDFENYTSFDSLNLGDNRGSTFLKKISKDFSRFQGFNHFIIVH